MLNGRYHGFGCIGLDGGSVYAGQFVGDKYNGVGRLIIGATGYYSLNVAPLILETFLHWSLNTSRDRGYGLEHK